MSKARGLASLGNAFDDGALSNRNLIINGAMQVAQRGTSVTGVTSTGYYACDRANVVISGLGTWTVSQDTDAPDGFSSSHKVLCTTADASPAAGDYMIAYRQKLEGQDLQHLEFGTSSAKSLTISFWVKSNKTGNASLDILNDDNSRSAYPQYTINSADTWEYKTVIISGDTVGSLNNDNGSSFQIMFWINSGSNFTGGSHRTTFAASENTDRNSSNLGVGGAINDYWQITGIQLEVGDTATPFEHRSFGQELALCQRYYTKFSFPQTTSFFPSHRQTTNTVRTTVTTPVPMRATPSINGSGQPNIRYHWGNDVSFLVDSGNSLTVLSSGLDANRFTINNGSVTGVGANVGAVFAYSGYLECNAEL